ncbi:hypothetical protein ACR6C2_08305 [Streptomyces sp. INA 01156]
MHATVVLAAAHAAPGINGMQFLGPITVTGFAAASGICLFAGLRGSDRIKIQNRDQALIWGSSPARCGWPPAGRGPTSPTASATSARA